MLKSRIQDAASILNGFCKVLESHLKATSSTIEHIKSTSQNLDDLKKGLNDAKSKITENLAQNPVKIIVCLILSVFAFKK